MRVIFFQHAAAMGGSAVSLGITAVCLREQHQVDPVICLVRPSEQLRRYYEQELGLTVVLAPSLPLLDYSTVAPQYLWDPRTWRALTLAALKYRTTRRCVRRVIAQCGAEIAHLNSMPLALTAKSIRKCGIPVVQHVREPARARASLRRALLVRASKDADVRVFLSEFDRDSWSGDQSDFVIPNYVDTSAFRPPSAEERGAARGAFGISHDDCVILYLGGPASAKGANLIVSLVDAMGQHPSEGGTVTFLLLGADAPRRASLTARAYRHARGVVRRPSLGDRIRRLSQESPGTNPRVMLRPPTTDALRAYWASDILVAPSQQPHFSRPVVEASAVGLPAVGSNVPGVRELMVDGKTGFLVPADDVVAWQSQLYGLIDCPDLRQVMGRAAREKALSDFDASEAVSQIAEIYHSVIR